MKRWEVSFFAKKVITGVKKIPATAVSKFLYSGLPVTHSDWENRKFHLVTGKKISLDQCSQNFEYLFNILGDQNLLLTFKFQDLDNLHQTRIANHLFKLGFNSYKKSGKLAKPIKESILINLENKYEVFFVVDNPYWRSTLLHFSVTNAKNFYSLIKQKLVAWKPFSSAILGQFNIYYSRNNKIKDRNSIQEFFDNCYRKLKKNK